LIDMGLRTAFCEGDPGGIEWLPKPLALLLQTAPPRVMSLRKPAMT